jgi:hypothetical protein
MFRIKLNYKYYQPIFIQSEKIMLTSYFKFENEYMLKIIKLLNV